MVVKNKPNREVLYKLYVVDGLSPVKIAKIYNCHACTITEWIKGYDIHFRNIIEAANNRWKDPKTREEQRKRAIKQFEDPAARIMARENAIKQFEDLEQREKQREIQLKRYEDLLERKKARKRAIKQFEDPKRREEAKESMDRRWGNSLEREKLLEQQNKYWEDPKKHEEASARNQGQSYPDEWTGFVDDDRPHLIPAFRCLQLNPWFEGCVRHHIMSGVIIHIPADLHKSVWHRMIKDDREEKNMKEINKLAFKYLLGEL